MLLGTIFGLRRGKSDLVCDLTTFAFAAHAALQRIVPRPPLQMPNALLSSCRCWVYVFYKSNNFMLVSASPQASFWLIK